MDLMNNLQTLSDVWHESFGGETLADDCRGKNSHLDFRYNGPSFGAGASKCGERSGGHDRARSGKAAEVTAWDVILLMPHDDGIHDKEAPPWQPESVLLGDEWSTLKVQGYGYAPIGHQVKTGIQMCTMSERMNVDSHTVNE